MTNPNSMDKPEAQPALAASAGSASSALPDCGGYWWWRRKGAADWELVRISDFGREDNSSYLVAYGVDKGWGGWEVGIAPERFAGDWVQCLTPND